MISEQRAAQVPLVVDLDDTLVLTDTLHECTLALLRRKPWMVFLLPVWMTRGRSYFKARVARYTAFQPDLLPYRQDVLEFLRSERAAGRRLALATAADRSVADAIAGHLGLFSHVLASDQNINMKGATKRDALKDLFGSRGFDYIGDSRADVKVWEVSRIAHLAGPNSGLMRLAEAAGAERGLSFAGSRPSLITWLKAIRIYQWVKNLLIFVPLGLSHRFGIGTFARLGGAFLAFSVMASGTYVVNDLLDLVADRKHAGKRLRPFASGQLSIAQGLGLTVIFIGSGLAAAAWFGWAVLACFTAYAALTLAYSLWLKHWPILDVLVLAFLYTLRLFVGGFVANIHLSPWLFQFSIFLFLSLAFVKRYSELQRLNLENSDGSARGYQSIDLNTISQTGIASGLLAGLVLALYVNSPDVLLLYPRPYLLWWACPSFLFWISRIWLVTRRGEMDEDPILFAFRDGVSYCIAAVLAALVLLGSIGT